MVSETHPAEIECPECDGDGCSECDSGYFILNQCPSKFIGHELIADVQVVVSSEQHLPIAGGLLDQSAWWFELRELLRREENRIQNEKTNRQST